MIESSTGNVNWIKTLNVPYKDRSGVTQWFYAQEIVFTSVIIVTLFFTTVVMSKVCYNIKHINSYKIIQLNSPVPSSLNVLHLTELNFILFKRKNVQLAHL